MPEQTVLGLPADESFVHFNDAYELLKAFVRHTSPDTMAHAPSGFVGASPNHAMDLQGAGAFLADQHHVNNAELDPERVFGVLKDRPGDNRETVIGSGRKAGITEPRGGYGAMFFDLGIAATGARNAVRPPLGGQIGLASVVVRKCRLPLPYRHLVDAFFGLFHGPSPVSLPETEYRASRGIS